MSEFLAFSCLTAAAVATCVFDGFLTINEGLESAAIILTAAAAFRIIPRLTMRAFDLVFSR